MRRTPPPLGILRAGEGLSESAVELESHLALDLAPSDDRVQAAAFVSKRLINAMATAIVRARSHHKRRKADARADIRKAVISEVNAISLEMIHRAKDGFDALARAEVTFWVNTASHGNAAYFDEFDFEHLPFLRFHSEALAAALRLREQPGRVQLDALHLAHCHWELDSFEMRDGLGHQAAFAEMEQDRLRLAGIRSLRDQLTARLPPGVRDDVMAFYDGMVIGSIYPYAVPISLSPALRRDDLLFVAEAFRRLGDAFIIPFELRLSGAEGSVLGARQARLQYESGGVGLQLLSAWLKALDVLESARQCTICYRHASAISRCSAHATKTHETKVGRLGKRIRPGYLERLGRYVRQPPIKRLLREGPLSSPEGLDEMQAAAERTSLGPIARQRAIVLAAHLRGLLIVMSDDMQKHAEQLFHRIISVAALMEAQRPPVTLGERSQREEQRQAAKELLSLKGFFRAWCGTGRYSPEIDVGMLGFDRDHPVVHGRALAVQDMPTQMVGQRAWTEASEAFLAATTLSADDIVSILRQGQDKKAAAREIGIALSTVYTILQRSARSRRRQYLGPRWPPARLPPAVPLGPRTVVQRSR